MYFWGFVLLKSCEGYSWIFSYSYQWWASFLRLVKPNPDYEKINNKLYYGSLEKSCYCLVHMNTQKLFRDCDVKPVYILNLAIKIFDDIRYYNVIFRIFTQDYIAGTQVDS